MPPQEHGTLHIILSISLWALHVVSLKVMLVGSGLCDSNNSMLYLHPFNLMLWFCRELESFWSAIACSTICCVDLCQKPWAFLSIPMRAIPWSEFHEPRTRGCPQRTIPDYLSQRGKSLNSATVEFTELRARPLSDSSNWAWGVTHWISAIEV